MKRLQRWLRAVAFDARVKHHDLALRRARRELAGATGEEFDRVRQLVFDLQFCTDIGDCDHV